MPRPIVILASIMVLFYVGLIILATRTLYNERVFGEATKAFYAAYARQDSPGMNKALREMCALRGVSLPPPNLAEDDPRADITFVCPR